MDPKNGFLDGERGLGTPHSCAVAAVHRCLELEGEWWISTLTSKLVKQCHKPPVWFDGLEHPKNCKLGDGF